jgi:hypothetical protein
MKETDMKDWYIELYEDYPCERKDQLSQREGQVIREIGTLNTRIAGRTIQEWNEDNQEKIQEYRENHKETKKEFNKEYYQNNKEKLKEYHKEYGAERVVCDCGCTSRRDQIERHKRSLKHGKIMKELAKTQEKI